jgi:cell division protein FtsB
MTYEEDLKIALEDAVRREQVARRRSLTYTLIPIVMAAILIGVTWWQVSTATKELNETNQELTIATTQLLQSRAEFEKNLQTASQDIVILKEQSEQYQKEIQKLSANIKNYQQEIEQLKIERDNLQEAIDELGAQIEQSQGLRRYIQDVNLTLVLKSLLDEHAFQLLLDIWGMQEGSQSMWRPGGIGPDQFDSPGYAVYMLNKMGAITGDLEKIHYSLISMLPPSDIPADGDVVFYEGGYTMFYFNDIHGGQPFVIGMTPLGIVALKYDFAPIRMIGHVTYP